MGHNEIISRLNQNGHPQQQQAQAQQQSHQFDASNNANSANQYAANYSAYNPQQNQQPSTQTPTTVSMPINQAPNGQNGGTGTNGHGGMSVNDQSVGGANGLFENENPIDIVLVLLHQYPQIETWLQSMEYHGTVT